MPFLCLCVHANTICWLQKPDWGLILDWRALNPAVLHHTVNMWSKKQQKQTITAVWKVKSLTKGIWCLSPWSVMKCHMHHFQAAPLWQEMSQYPGTSISHVCSGKAHIHVNYVYKLECPSYDQGFEYHIVFSETWKELISVQWSPIKLNGKLGNGGDLPINLAFAHDPIQLT